MTQVRRAYQQAVLVPMHNMEVLWREWEQHENSLDKTLAKRLMDEYKPKHAAAKQVYRSRKKMWENIQTDVLALPPASLPIQELQFHLWSTLLEYERSNPQRLPSTIHIQSSVNVHAVLSGNLV